MCAYELIDCKVKKKKGQGTNHVTGHVISHFAVSFSNEFILYHLKLNSLHVCKDKGMQKILLYSLLSH